MKRTTTIRSALFIAALLVSTIAAADSSGPATVDVTSRFMSAGAPVSDLQAIEVGDILVLRGTATSPVEAANTGKIATDLGFTRVANLIRVVAPADDATIQRMAERELSRHRGLDGSRIRVSSLHGIVTLAGKVSQELQKDMAVALVRNIDGVRGVTSSLQR
jgi:osmotically-inducible protein OsmY